MPIFCLPFWSSFFLMSNNVKMGGIQRKCSSSVNPDSNALDPTVTQSLRCPLDLSSDPEHCVKLDLCQPDKKTLNTYSTVSQAIISLINGPRFMHCTCYIQWQIFLWLLPCVSQLDLSCLKQKKGTFVLYGLKNRGIIS